MRTIFSVLLLCLVAISAFAGDAVVTSETPQGKLELTVKTSSSEDQPDVITLDAVLKNLASGEVLAEPRVVFKPSEGFNISTKGDKDLFTASLSPTKSDQATLDVEYSINGEVVFAPRVTFQLP